MSRARAEILRCLAANPDLSAQDIGQLCGVTAAYINEIRGLTDSQREMYRLPDLISQKTGLDGCEVIIFLTHCAGLHNAAKIITRLIGKETRIVTSSSLRYWIKRAPGIRSERILRKRLHEFLAPQDLILIAEYRITNARP